MAERVKLSARQRRAVSLALAQAALHESRGNKQTVGSGVFAQRRAVASRRAEVGSYTLLGGLGGVATGALAGEYLGGNAKLKGALTALGGLAGAYTGYREARGKGAADAEDSGTGGATAG